MGNCILSISEAFNDLEHGKVMKLDEVSSCDTATFLLPLQDTKTPAIRL